MTTELDGLREALALYADPANYDAGGMSPGGLPCVNGLVHDYDRGETARKALGWPEPRFVERNPTIAEWYGDKKPSFPADDGDEERRICSIVRERLPYDRAALLPQAQVAKEKGE